MYACVHMCNIYVHTVHAKKSVCKVSNGRETAFEVLCGVREMYM